MAFNSYFFLSLTTTPHQKTPPLIPTDAAASKAAAAQLLRRYVLDALRASGRADAEAYSQCVVVFSESLLLHFLVHRRSTNDDKRRHLTSSMPPCPGPACP